MANGLSACEKSYQQFYGGKVAFLSRNYGEKAGQFQRM